MICRIFPASATVWSRSFRRLIIRVKSTMDPTIAAAAHKKGLLKSFADYFRSGGGREDITAIGTGLGGFTATVTAFYFIVGSMQSSHEKITQLTNTIETERSLRDKDIARLTDNMTKERELRTEGIQKERELRDKDAVRLTDNMTAGIQKERELRTEGIKTERELRTEGIQKERELRDKDAAIMKLELVKEQEVAAAKRAAMESELRALKIELENARKAIESKGK